VMMLTPGQKHDRSCAQEFLDWLPQAAVVIADCAYDADGFRRELAGRGFVACIPSKRNRFAPIPCDRTLYRKRSKIENSFPKLKDWRRIATRYDRCGDLFFAAATIAVIVAF